MGHVPRSLRIAALLLLTALAADATRAEDAPGPTAGAKVRNRRRADLRNAAGKWITHRARFPSTCPLCQGSGRVPGREGRRLVLVECPQCEGRGGWVSPKDYRVIYYDLRTPEFQSLPGIRETLEQQYRAANSGSPWPTRIPRYRIRSWELVDLDHGIVWFLFADARSPTATYWIWSPGAGSRGGWCVYDARSDGAWPSVTDDDATPTPFAPGDWEPVNPVRVAALRAAAAQAKLSFRAVDFLRRGDVLRACMEPRDPGPENAPAIAGEALRLLPALLQVATGWARVEAEWRTPWRNPDGDERLLPTWTSCLDRTAFAARDWTTLTASEQLAAVAWTSGLNPGWQPLLPQAPQSPPQAPPQAPPAPPDDSVPDAPPPPEPAPPRPPLRETEPTPEPPGEAAPVPELSASVRSKAEKGVAHIDEVFALAKKAHDEGVLAHRSGSHDLWQEKLREVRAHLSEIEAVWNEEVVAAMPGGDDAEREIVANEHFGKIWNEIYELKAMVRKMSAP